MKYNKFSKLPKSCCIFYVKKQILTSCYKLVQGFRVTWSVQYQRLWHNYRCYLVAGWIRILLLPQSFVWLLGFGTIHCLLCIVHQFFQILLRFSSHQFSASGHSPSPSEAPHIGHVLPCPIFICCTQNDVRTEDSSILPESPPPNI